MSPIAPTPAPAAPSAPASASASDRAALKKAAQGFEAIFVRQMLAAARATSLAGDDPIFGGQAQKTFTQMRDERFADIAAQAGTFGLAKQLEAQFARLLPPAPPAAKE